MCQEGLRGRLIVGIETALEAHCELKMRKLLALAESPSATVAFHASVELETWKQFKEDK